MPDGIKKRTIDLYFNQRRSWPHCAAGKHRDRGRRRRFGSFFVHRNECFVENLRNVEVIVRFPLSDLIEICAALWLIERGLDPERFKLFGQSDGRRLEFELW